MEKREPRNGSSSRPSETPADEISVFIDAEGMQEIAPAVRKRGQTRGGRHDAREPEEDPEGAPTRKPPMYLAA